MGTSFSLGRVRTNAGTAETVMLLDNRHIPLADAAERLKVSLVEPGMRALLADWDYAQPMLQAIADGLESLGAKALEEITLHAPELISPIPRPGKVLCAAANYSAHVAEMTKTGFTGPSSAQQNAPRRPDAPYHFLKATSCSVGPYDDIRLPGADHRIDWEIELAAVVGRPAYKVSAGQAMDHVAGYVVINDVSCRAATWREDRPNIRSDWLAGKSYDTFLPTGPYFVPASQVPDYRALQLRLWVNGQLKQDGVASGMIFSLEDQLAYLSAMLTLESGDLIATGTPAGVGQGTGSFLVAGDIVEAEITGLGRQRNTVVAA
ncbi:MAG: fumarylacetoacetate hydrolase family protein [Mesorhizobium sp.]|nr:fumarylacetoacetate hydrolase family protein [Mesorhizobium sp.]MCO5161237.1 fumarylacetoacetate hydrolase family protein [Mesorhizobium sp.]